MSKLSKVVTCLLSIGTVYRFDEEYTIHDTGFLYVINHIIKAGYFYVSNSEGYYTGIYEDITYFIDNELELLNKEIQYQLNIREVDNLL